MRIFTKPYLCSIYYHRTIVFKCYCNCHTCHVTTIVKSIRATFIKICPSSVISCSQPEKPEWNFLLVSLKWIVNHLTSNKSLVKAQKQVDNLYALLKLSQVKTANGPAICTTTPTSVVTKITTFTTAASRLWLARDLCLRTSNMAYKTSFKEAVRAGCLYLLKSAEDGYATKKAYILYEPESLYYVHHYHQQHMNLYEYYTRLIFIQFTYIRRRTRTHNPPVPTRPGHRRQEFESQIIQNQGRSQRGFFSCGAERHWE